VVSQAVRDLCWVINSPSLIDGPGVARAERLDPDAVDAEALAAFLTEQPPGHRVGRYFEQLLYFWLLHVRKVDVIEHGLQLKDGKITVGEIDFLYRDEADVLIHCEISVKFFLCAPGSSPSSYPGPNARDNFERKVGKLFDKQLPASVGRVEGIGRREAFVKGMIFYRIDGRVAPTPERLAPGHLRGVWCRNTSIDDLADLGDLFAIVNKPQWLAPVGDATVMDADAFRDYVEDHFLGPAHPIMVSVRTADSADREVQRVIVVDEQWPALGANPH